MSSEKKVLNTPTRPLKEDIKKYQKQISTNQKLIKQAEEIIRKLASFKQFKHLTGFEKENYIDGHWKHIDRLENKNELLREKMEMLEKKTEKVETLRAEKRRH